MYPRRLSCKKQSLQIAQKVKAPHRGPHALQIALNQTLALGAVQGGDDCADSRLNSNASPKSATSKTKEAAAYFAKPSG